MGDVLLELYLIFSVIKYGMYFTDIFAFNGFDFS